MIENCVQTLFIKCLNPVFKYTQRIDKRVRDGIAGFMLFLTTMLIDMNRSTYLREMFITDSLPNTFSRHLVCTVLIVIAGLLSIDRALERVVWRRSVFLVQLFVGVGMVIISFIHPVGSGYRLMGFQLVLLFPFLYFIWNNRKDYDILFRQLSYSMVAAGLIMFLITVVIARTGLVDMSENQGLRFIGIMQNASCYSLLGLEMYLGGVYLLIAERKILLKEITCCVSMGLGLGMILTGQMRLAALAVVVCSIVSVGFKVGYFRENINKRRVEKLLAGCLIILLMTNAAYGTVRTYNRIMEEKNAEAALEDGTSIMDRFSAPSEGGMEKYSSGRLWIWGNYWRELNWIGHDRDQFDKEKMTGRSFGYAHDVFLEVAYRFGIPIGVAFLVYMLVCGIVCLHYLFSKGERKEPYLLFPIIACIVFVLLSLLDCALMPFFQPETISYYISIAIVIDKEAMGKTFDQIRIA